MIDAEFGGDEHVVHLIAGEGLGFGGALNLDEAAVAQIVEETIRETGATSLKEMGNVMKAVMARLAGQTVDGKLVNQLVKAKLGG